MPKAPKDVMNSLIKLGVIQKHPLVNEMNKILGADQIFSPLAHGNLAQTLLSLWDTSLDPIADANTGQAVTYPPMSSAHWTRCDDGDGNPLVLRQAPSGAIVREGYRVVENDVPTSSEDNTVGTFGARADYGATTTNVTLNSSSSYWYRRTDKTYAAGATVRLRVKLRKISTGNAIALRMHNTVAASEEVKKLIDVSGGGDVTASVELTLTTAGKVDFGIDARSAAVSGTEAGEYLFTEYQIENVTGRSNQNPSEYIPVNGTIQVSSGIEGFAYFKTRNGNTVDANGVVTEATGADIPASQLGVVLVGGYAQELSTTTDMTSSEVVSLAAGTYTLWMEGSGSVSATGATDGSYGSATDGTHLTFTVTTTQNVTFANAGTVDIINVNDQPVPMPYTDLSSVSPSNDVQLTLADIGFDGASEGQISLELAFHHDFADLPASDASIISLNNETGASLLYHKSNHALAVSDGTNSVEASTTILKDTNYAIDVAWKGSTFSIYIDGVLVGSGVWDGDMNAGVQMALAKGYGYGLRWRLLKAFDGVAV